jgi:uncharacterized membrane protein YkvA (DUF1232 family)
MLNVEGRYAKVAKKKLVKVKKRKPKRIMKGRMRNFLMFLPNMVRLCGNLLIDNRVPITEKALFAAAIVYAISPIDFIPDVFPFIGQVDDIYLISLTLLRLLNHTEANVVRQHWKGGGDIIGLAASIAKMAPMLLPQRISRVISSKVKLGSAGKVLDSVKNKEARVLVEIPQKKKKVKVDSSSSMNN